MATTKLTDRQVAAARAEAGRRLELWDTTAPGLALRVTDQGRKTWIVRYRTHDGRQPRLTLGTYPSLGLAEAREEAGKATRAAREGRDISSEQRQAKVAAKAQPLKTLSDLAATYFSACEIGEYRPKGKQKRASTWAEERGLWRRHAEEPLGDLRIEEVTPDAIKKVLRGLVAKGHGVTSNRVRSLLRQMFNFAISEERIATNPVSKVPILAAETPRERVLSDAEMVAVWSALEQPEQLSRERNGREEPVYIGPGTVIALRLLLLTLTRRAEVAGMKRAELDLKQAVWSIPGSRTKTGAALLVPLSPKAVGLIQAALDLSAVPDSPFVFPSPRDPQKAVTPESLSHALRSLRLALNLPRLTPHDLRRTAATAMASERLGISPVVIGRVLNHSTERGGAAAVTLRHYALHDYAIEKRRALSSWEELLLSIVGERPRPENIVRLVSA